MALCSVLVGDLGGTNGRLALCDVSCSILVRKDYLIRDHANLQSMLNKFLEDSGIDAGQINVAVLAMCGPVWDAGRTNDHNNSHWRLTRASDVEEGVGLRPAVLSFENDFAANGWAITLLHQSDAPEEAVPTGLIPLHAAIPEPGAPLACVGAGTGLGAVFMAPYPEAPHPSDAGAGGPVLRYSVCPSEAGMVSTVCPQNESEWRLLQHLRGQRQTTDGAHVDVERIVSGPGLVEVYRFLRTEAGLPADSDPVAPVTPESVSKLAESGVDARASAAVDLFLHHYGRVLCVAALTFMPFGGLYIAGGILPKLAWAWQAKGGSSESDGSLSVDPDGPLMRGYYEAGPPLLRGLVARAPLTLVTDGELGIKGCLAIAAGRLRASAGAHGAGGHASYESDRAPPAHLYS